MYDLGLEGTLCICVEPDPHVGHFAILFVLGLVPRELVGQSQRLFIVSGAIRSSTLISCGQRDDKATGKSWDLVAAADQM